MSTASESERAFLVADAERRREMARAAFDENARVLAGAATRMAILEKSLAEGEVDARVLLDEAGAQAVRLERLRVFFETALLSMPASSEKSRVA
jgi:hypothetical protein